MSEYDKLKNPDGSVAKALSATERLKVLLARGLYSHTKTVAKALSATERLKLLTNAAALIHNNIRELFPASVRLFKGIFQFHQ